MTDVTMLQPVPGAKKIIDRILREKGRRLQNGCIEAIGHLQKTGYVAIYVSEVGATGHAHRLISFLCDGLIEEGVVVMHRCDNRACMNPDHLVRGTAALNNADTRSKGRAYSVPKGENSPTARYTDEDIRRIRREASVGAPYSEIARWSGMDRGAISRIARGVVRKCAGGPISPRRRRHMLKHHPDWQPDAEPAPEAKQA